MREIDMKAAMAPRFESGQGVVLMARDMPDTALLMAIKTAASFDKPFKVAPPVEGGMMATANAMLGLQAKNDAYTEAELDAAVKRGSAAAAENIAAGQKLYMEDESSLDRLQNAYAMGWNSQYGSEENQRLWDEFKAARNAG